MEEGRKTPFQRQKQELEEKIPGSYRASSGKPATAGALGEKK